MSHKGQLLSYSTPCTAVMAAAYSDDETPETEDDDEEAQDEPGSNHEIVRTIVIRLIFY